MANERPIERLSLACLDPAAVGLEVRSGQNSRAIGGYAAVFDKHSENLGGFRERVAPGVFNKSRADGWPGVVARFNHSDEHLLGAVGSGTLRLTVDQRGLNYDVDLPECRSDILELVQRRDLRHSSFAFQMYEDDWGTTDGGVPLRTLVSARLLDVAPVTIPAYPDSTVALRSLARHVDAPLADVQRLSATGELRKLLKRTDLYGKPFRDGPGRSPAQARLELLKRRYEPEPPRRPRSGREAFREICDKVAVR